MSRDPCLRNAEAEYHAGRPRWQPKVQCADCGLLTSTYSRIAGRPWCPTCAPAARKTLALYGHLPTDERKPKQ